MTTEERLMFVMNRYDKKLKDLMPLDEYYIFTSDVARDAFRKEIEDMEDNDFKRFCFDHFDEITR